MKLYRIFGYSLASIVAATVSWASHAVQYTVAAVVSFIDAAFPATPPPELAAAMAAAPSVLGLHETRSFLQRRIDRSPDGRRRAPLSSAFAAAA